MVMICLCGLITSTEELKHSEVPHNSLSIYLYLCKSYYTAFGKSESNFFVFLCQL